MEFVLRIELGNDAMRTADDVVRALKEEADYIKKSAAAWRGDLNKLQGFIRDANGNKVGTWEFKNEDEHY